MSKKVRNLIIGLVALLVLGGVLAVLLLTGGGSGANVSSDDGLPEDTTVKVLEKDESTIASIQVKNQEDEYTMVKNGENWEIASLKGFTQVQDVYKTTLSRTAALTAEKEVESNVQKLSTYGLDKPHTQVTISYNDKTPDNILLLGGEAPSGGYYGKLGSSNTVYIFAEGIIENFLKPRYYYLEVNINQDSRSTAPTVRHMEVRRKDLDKPIIITAGDPVRDDDPLKSMKTEFIMTSPFRAELDKEETEGDLKLFFTLAGNSIVAVNPTAADRSKYGFDDPTMTITVKDSKGDTHTLKTGKGIYCDEDPDEVEENHVHTIQEYYVMYDDKPMIYTASASELVWMDMQVKDLISNYVLTPVLTDLSKIEVEAGGKTYTMEISSKTNTVATSADSEVETTVDVISVSVNGKPVTVQTFKDFYQFLIQVTVEDLVTTAPTESPTMKITYHYVPSKNKSADVLEFIPYGERKAAIALNGQVNFVTRSAFIDRTIENLEKIAKNQEINANW